MKTHRLVRVESYELSLQFPREQDGNFNRGYSVHSLQAMKEYESRIKADAVKNSKDWFGKAKMSDAVVDALFTPMLKYPKDKNTGESRTLTRTPTLRVKIPYYDSTLSRLRFTILISKMIFPRSGRPF